MTKRDFQAMEYVQEASGGRTEAAPLKASIKFETINHEYARVAVHGDDGSTCFPHSKARRLVEAFTKRIEEGPNPLLLRSINEFMNEALFAIAGAVSTPETGYVKDGGLQLLLSDIKRLRKQHDFHKNRNGVVAAQVEQRDATIATLTAEAAELRAEVGELAAESARRLVLLHEVWRHAGNHTSEHSRHVLPATLRDKLDSLPLPSPTPTPSVRECEAPATPINIFLDGGDDPSLFTLENFFGEHGSGIRIADKDCGAAVELGFRDYSSARAFRDRMNVVVESMIQRDIEVGG